MRNKETKEAFAANLKYYMAITGKRKIDISRDLGVSYQTVAGWFNWGKLPQQETVSRLADYFGVSQADLLMKKRIEMPEETSAQKAQFDVVGRMNSDEAFCSFVKDAMQLDERKLKGLHEVLKSIYKLPK